MKKYLPLFEKILFWLAVGLLVFIPLYPKFPLISVAGTFVAVRLEDILIAGVLGLWGVYVLLSGKLKDYLSDRLYQAFLLFFGIGLLSVFSAAYVTHTIDLHLGILHYLRRIELMALLPLMVTVVRTRKQVKQILLILSVVAFIVCFYAIGQQYFHFPLVSTTNSEFAKGQIIYLTPAGRVNSTFAGHYDLAIFLMMIICVVTASIFSYGFRGVIWNTILLGLSSFVLILTAARFSFVAAVGGIALSLLLTGRKKLILVLLVIMVGVMLYPSQLRSRLLSTITVNFQMGGERYQATPEEEARQKLNIPTLNLQVASSPADATRSATTSARIASDIAPGEPLDTTQLGVYRSFQIRFNVEWPRALRTFYRNPLLGSGYSSLGLAVDNDILRSLGEVGLLGTAAFALILIEILKRLWHTYRNGTKFMRAFTAGVISMTLAMIINGMFIDVFEASKVAALFWMILGINLAMGKYQDE